MKRKHSTRPAEPVALTIEKLVYGGDGLARRDGVTYFVPFVAPGEKILARPVDVRRSFVRARIAEISQPSAERMEAECRHFTVCGGCHYQHIRYQAQLRAKAEIVRETLGRLGQVNWNGTIELHGSPPYGYRNRAQWKVRHRQGAEGAREHGLAIGYFHASSNQLCAVVECPVLAPALAKALAALLESLGSGGIRGAINEIEAFTEPEGSMLVNVSLVRLPESPRRLIDSVREAIPEARSVLLQETAAEGMELDGPGSIEYRVGEERYRVGHMSFFQVNRFLVEEMAAAVAGGAEGGLAMDLHAGVGLFSVPLSRRFERVIAVEADPAATRDLEANLENAGGAAKAVNSDAGQFLDGTEERPDLVVVDPPRTGVSGEALAALGRLRPREIRYLSCDPATLARDLKVLTNNGYVLSKMSVFDVFPQTYHIETLAHLTQTP